MFVLTRKAEYALLAMAYLRRRSASETGEVASAREIAAEYDIPLSVLMNLLKTLQREGLVTSVRGARGGYQLARAAEQVSLADVIEAIEGPMRVTPCTDPLDSLAPGSCERLNWCPVRGPAQVVQEKLDEFFREISLAELVERSCPAGAMSIP